MPATEPKKALRLLVGGGICVGIGIAALWFFREEATVGDTAGCESIGLGCDLYVKPTSRFARPAGEPPYVTAGIVAQLCPDPENPATRLLTMPTLINEVLYEPSTCVAVALPSPLPTQLNEPFALLPFRCACSSGSACQVGGGAAPEGTTLTQGTFSGAGCIPKACVEIAGISSWPSTCPRPTLVISPPDSGT